MNELDDVMDLLFSFFFHFFLICYRVAGYLYIILRELAARVLRILYTYR